MSAAGEPYVHGYSDAEQQRLLEQAEYWRTTLIPRGLDYGPGEAVLEVGCAAGAALGVLADTFPGIRIAGVDREPRQIEFARRQLGARGYDTCELRVGDATDLPWPEDSFDHVFMMWFLEHLPDTSLVLAEALRVLAPGGAITITETDYTTFRIHPPSDDYEALRRAQHDWFARHGNPVIGRLLGPLLRAAGFVAVRNAPAGFHFFHDGNSPGLRNHVDYCVAFLGPMIDTMATDLGRDAATLRRGLEHLRAVPDHRFGSLTQIVYRAQARKPRRAP